MILIILELSVENNKNVSRKCINTHHEPKEPRVMVNSIVGQFSDLRILLHPDMLEGIFIFKASGTVSVGSILKV